MMKIPEAILERLEWISFENDIPLDKIIEQYSRTDTHLRDVGSKSLVDIYTNDTPGQTKTLSTIKKIIRNKK